MSRPRYWKTQTQWVRYPAAIDALRHNDVIGIRVHPERPAGTFPREPVSIFLTPHEAQAFAAWLSEQAEHVLAKQARAAARKAARQAAKESQP